MIAAAKPGATLEATLSYRRAPLPTCTEAKWQSHYGPRLMSVPPCSVPLTEPKSFTARTEATVIMCVNIVALLCSSTPHPPPPHSALRSRDAGALECLRKTRQHHMHHFAALGFVLFCGADSQGGPMPKFRLFPVKMADLSTGN